MQPRQRDITFKPIWDIRPDGVDQWQVIVNNRRVAKYQTQKEAYGYINTLLMQYITEVYTGGST